jgi:transposase
MPEESLSLPGLSLARVEEAAIRAAFVRLNGNRRAMARELRVSRSTLLRKLARYGLRVPRKQKPRHLLEEDIARAFEWHRRQLVEDLRIADSTFIRWLNKSAPFAVEEG